MSDLIEKLNCFIKQEISNYDKILNKRKNKISFFNVLEYAFLYSNINNTKENSKAETNINNNVVHSRSSYERNLNKIPCDFFVQLYKKIKSFYNDEMKKFKHITDILHNNDQLEEFTLDCNKKICGVDGICGNIMQNNELYTNLDVYSFDVINELPLDIMDNLNANIKIFDNNINNKSNKNHETTILNNFVENNDDIKNTIYIGDRLYSTYTVMDNLENNNLNYIIRLKDNLDIINKTNSDIDKSKNHQKSNIVNNKKNRIIEYNVLSTEIIKIKNKIKTETKIETKNKKNKTKDYTKDKTKDKIKDKTKDGTKDKTKTKGKIKPKDEIKTNIKTEIKTEGGSKIEIKTETKTKDVKIKTNQKYYLITNLPEEEYPDKLIEILYKFRWKIEVYFKCLKNKFKFDAFYLKDNDEITKLKYIEMIIYILNKMCYIYCLDKYKCKLNTKKEKKSYFIYNKDLRFAENKKNRDNFIKNKFAMCSLKVNLSLSFDGFYKLLLHNIIRGELTEEILEKYYTNYIIIIKNDLNRTFKRESIMPYSKWYIKKYHKSYELKKIINAIIKDNIEKLNKNLKLKAKDLMENIKDKSTLVKLKEFINI